jgi:hypothetical protein
VNCCERNWPDYCLTILIEVTIVKKTMWLFIFALVCVVGAGGQNAKDLYWIIYRGEAYRQNGSFFYPTRIFQIDSRGAVLIPPQKIIPEFDSFYGSFILGPGSRGDFNLWGHVTLTGAKWETIRIPVNGRTLETGTASVVNQATYTYQSVTNREINNFILIRSRKPIGRNVTAAGLNSYGVLNGTFSPLYDEADHKYLDGEISKDGRVLLLTIGKQIFFQRLDKNGNLSGNRHLLRTLGPYLLGSATITDTLPGGHRLVAYSDTYIRHNGFGCDYFELSLQMVDAHGRLVGQRIHLLTASAESCDYNIEALLDPGGRFVIYTDIQYRSRELFLYSPLMYVALDSDGHPVGRRFPIAANDAYGFDMMEAAN